MTDFHRTGSPTNGPTNGPMMQGNDNSMHLYLFP